MKINLKSCTACLPGKKIESSELEEQLDLSQGWAEKNSGVLSRYRSDPGETIAAIGAKVLQQTLTAANLRLNNLDLLIFAGGSFDHPIPYNACLIKQLLDDQKALFPCFDIDSTCLSFINALDIAHLYLQNGRYQRIAIVCAELPTSSLNPGDPKTYTLFGDAAVAVVLEATEMGSDADYAYTPGVAHFVNFSEGADLAMIPAGGIKQPGFLPNVPRDDFYFRMDGRKLIALTLRVLDDFVEDWKKLSGRDLLDYDWIVPHQTSKFGNEVFLHRYNIPSEKVLFSLPYFGNCVSASIPLGLNELYGSGKIKPGSKVLLLGSAAGLSIGGMELLF